VIIKDELDWWRRQLRITTKCNRFCNSDICFCLYKDARIRCDPWVPLGNLEIAGKWSQLHGGEGGWESGAL
jgi:hypothetical protein